MKIKPEHIEHLRNVIDNFADSYTLEDYKREGLSEKRWRWDLSFRAGLIPWICANIYPYANDDHLDTALRHITQTK